MVQTNIIDREVSMKIVYYGTTSSGKKTNLEVIHHKTPPERRKDIEIDKDGESGMYFFQYIPEASFEIAKMKVKCDICAISGSQASENKITEWLKGVDGIIFVVDSQKDKVDDNLSALKDLEEYLKICGYNIENIPLIFQWNKQDLPEVETIEELNEKINKFDSKNFKASAVLGQGVFPTLEAMLEEVQKNVEQKMSATHMPKKIKITGKFKMPEKKEVTQEKEERQKKEEKSKDKKNKLATPLADKLKKIKVKAKEEKEEDKKIVLSFPKDQEIGEDTETKEMQAPMYKELESNTSLFEEEIISSSKDQKKEEKSLKKLLPKKKGSKLEEKKQDEIIKDLKDGKPIEKIKIDVLDFTGETFLKPVHILNSQIDKILAEGAEFKAPLIFEDVEVKEIDLCKGTLSIFRDTVTFKRLSLKEDINLDKAIFCKELSILDCNWKKKISLQDSIFEKGFSINNSEIEEIFAQGIQVRGDLFISDSSFSMANFQKAFLEGEFSVLSSNFNRLHARNANFMEKVVFSASTFETTANYDRINCDKGLFLEGCVFNGNVSFREASVKDTSEFHRTDFWKDVSLSKTLFTGPVLVEKTTFGSLTDFSLGYFGHIEFLNSDFEGNANFQDVIFSEKVSFLNCCFKKNVIFSRTLFFEKIDFSVTKFEGLISLADIVGEYVVLSWDQVKNKIMPEKTKDYEAAEKEYKTIKKILEQQGNDKEKDYAHYKAKKYARKKLKFSLNPFKQIKKILEWIFLDIGCKYGTKPCNLIFIALFFILAFAAVFGLYYSNNFDISTQPEWRKWAEVSVQSLVVFLPSGIAKISALKDISLFKMLVIAENFIGFVVIFSFIILFIRKLLQD